LRLGRGAPLAQTTQDAVENPRTEYKALYNRKITSLQGFDAQAPDTGKGEDILAEAYFQKKICKMGAKACPEVLPALTERIPLAVACEGESVPDT